jgi:glycosyltransferase involved in cell wall biosynthesis
MSAPVAVLLSYRLGGDDGVSIESNKWEWALRALGFATRRVAADFEDGLRPDDTWLGFLAIDPAPGARAEPDTLAASLAGAELVVVENLCSLPLNVDAARAASSVLSRFPGRVVFHHHDLPWERPELEHFTEFPPRRPGSLHVAISDHARRGLSKRGIPAVTIRNSFDTHVAPGDRSGTRAKLGYTSEDFVVLQPTRAIPRKDVPRGIGLAEQLDLLLPGRAVRYWLTGPAEDGYGATLDRIVAEATVTVMQGRVGRVADAYAASDLVVVPSSWEGFGNPIVEAMLAERPVVAGRYPALDELGELGLRPLPIDDVAKIGAFAQQPDLGLLARNRRVAAHELALDRLPSRLEQTFRQIGWEHW